jgi:hypothetical protein
VPVSRDGTAEVPLSDEMLDLPKTRLRPAIAQLAWTLRQVPGIDRLRVTVNGSPVELPGSGTVQSIDAWGRYDPAVRWASEELFGIREGRVVTLVGGEERRISGLFGSTGYGLRSIAVNLSAGKVAGVTGSGSRVVVAPRARALGETPGPSSASVAYSGADVLRPAWDLYGQLWVVDRRRSGAALSVVRSGEATRVDVPGITGRDVRAFVLSRDGTRFVAVVAGRGGDRLMTARVRRDATGRVRRMARAERLPVGALRVDDIRDVDWRTPGTVALLTGQTTGPSQVVIARIDGSSALGDLAANADLLREDAARVITSPAPGAPLYVGTSKGALFELSTDGRWTGTGIRDGLLSPTFVG